MPVPTSTLITAPAEDLEGSTSSLTPAHINSNIWVAAGEGDLESVRHLLETQAHLTPTTPDDFSYTPLHAAASYAQLDMLRFLLTHPKATSYQPPASDVSGVPALTGAANVLDSDGDTPLFVCETVEPAQLLIEEFGADPTHLNHEGKTAAWAAYENEAYEVAEYLRSITGEPEPELDEEDDQEDDVADEEEEYDDDHEEHVGQEEANEDDDDEEKAGDANDAAQASRDASTATTSNPAAPT